MPRFSWYRSFVFTLSASSLLVSVYGAGNTTCLSSQLDWYTDAVGESPCMTYQRLRQICDADYEVPSFRPNTPGDNCDSQNSDCCCNSVSFALSMLCMNCQQDAANDPDGIDAGNGAYWDYLSGTCSQGLNYTLPAEVQTAVCSQGIKISTYIYQRAFWSTGAWYYAWTQGFASEQYSSNSSTATGYCANEVLAASPPSSSAPPPPSSSDSSSGPSSSSEPPATSSAVSSPSVSSVIVTSTNSLGNVTYYYTSAILPTLSPSGSPIVAAVKSTPMPMGAIIGAAVGGVVLIALLVLAGLCYRRRHKKSSASGTRGPPIGEAWDDRRVLGPRIISHRAPTSGGDDASLFSDSAPSNRHDSQASLLHTSMFGSSLSPVRAEHGLRPHPNLPRLDELSSQPPAADTSAEKTADISLSNWNSHSNVHRNAEIPDVPLSPGLTTSSLLLSPQPTRRVVIEEDAGHLDGHRPPTARLPPAYNPAWDSRD